MWSRKLCGGLVVWWGWWAFWNWCRAGVSPVYVTFRPVNFVVWSVPHKHRGAARIGPLELFW